MWAGFKDVPKEFRTEGGKATGVAGAVRRSGSRWIDSSDCEVRDDDRIMS